ncbi:LacI family DNA-binding transcriptional regulator [Leifsonia sp. L25]|uniref:LacI family DNA-binding transcriptional regulator n=1 Tax=Leifsonia sp. L25 TaxID=3423957 RepID=UPI003D68406D
MVEKPTIADIARELGLSKSAVSNALRGLPQVSVDTAARVKAYALERGWRPNAAARALSLARSDNVGIALVQAEQLLRSEPFYMNAIAGIERVLSPNGKNLLLRTIEAADDELAVYESWITEGRVDGVILFDPRLHDPRPRLLMQGQLPFAVYGESSTLSPTELVVEETQTIVEHLASRGHTNALFIGGPGNLAHERDRADQLVRLSSSRGIRVVATNNDYSIEGGGRPPEMHSDRRSSRLLWPQATFWRSGPWPKSPSIPAHRWPL